MDGAEHGDGVGPPERRRGSSAAARDRLRALASGHTPAGSDIPARPSVRVLDERSRALLRLTALLTTGGGSSAFDRHVSDALAAGAAPDDLVEVLIEVAPTLGLARLVPATTELAAALGYDIDEAVEAVERTSRGVGSG